MSVELEAPDRTTLSRRSQDLNVDLHRVAAGKSIHLIVDSTGLSIVGEGEWAAVKYGRLSPLPCARDRTIMRVKEIGRRRWNRESGYHQQARVENTFFRYKSIIGHRLRARHPKSQEAEALIACNILNLMTEIGRPESISISA
jgi:hypothetical protein